MSRTQVFVSSLLVIAALSGCDGGDAGPQLPTPSELVPGEWNEIVPGT